MQTAPVEISVNGQIVAVPAAVVNARTVIVTGRWLRVATLEDEEWLEGETVGDPEQFLATLRQTGLGADLFTFAQKLSEPDPRYQYPLE